MKRFHVIFSDAAEKDIYRLYDSICYVYKQPFTAFRYVRELNNIIRKLSVYAASVAVTQNVYIQSLYGPDARRINYRNIAVIYLIEGDSVHIKRVMAASLIR
ncbi:MAG: type II toxin-antitoxin system RelE/ParE family toxin [Tannerellaceae bacterium]|jgi:plasmid stabilization system protein ParE|nr:type II toxin-antitoxin system RelE/ParE family toxin [Tannerellaceae bacterium]